MPAKYGDIGTARGSGRQAHTRYPFTRPKELDSGEKPHYSVIIVGGGPIGLATAIALGKFDIDSVVLEKHDSVSDGSRAICWAKRALEILDRYGTGEQMLEKGVTWNIGKVFFGDNLDPLYEFDMLADKEQKFPAFVNLQQYYAEEFLIDQLQSHRHAELRWQNEVISVENRSGRVKVVVKTPEGNYEVTCDYLVAADGHRSPVRNMLDLDFEGRVFEDNFLIADVRMHTDYPAERRFWFNPPFHSGQTALLHRQADDVWRIDFQMGWDIDRETVLEEGNVDAKIREFLGSNVEFDYEWVSLYTFQCRRMNSFVHNRVIFIGDSAHLVSPFGARGANGGLQDVDNLAWKLALVLRRLAPEKLLATYDEERTYGADENILNSSRSTDFITPKSQVSTAFRDAVLELARDFEFARPFVNSGRLSVPCTLDNSSLNTPDQDDFDARQRPGSPCIDAAVEIDGRSSWFLNQLGERFVGIYFSDDAYPVPPEAALLAGNAIPIEILIVTKEDAASGTITDHLGLVHKHYDATPGSFYIIRPDQHVAARWRTFKADEVSAALARATAQLG